MSSKPIHTKIKTLAILCGGFAVIAITWTTWLRWEGPKKSNALSLLGSHPLNEAAVTRSTLQTLSRADNAGKTEDALPNVSYRDYLDSLCRPLTAAQEDRIVAQSKHDRRILAGLALIGSSRAKEWLREALRQTPDDPLVLYAILVRMDTDFDRLKLARSLADLAHAR